MNKISAPLGSSVFGLAVCLAFVWLSQAIGISPEFPSPGGEDDFSLRMLWFLFAVCPAFLVLGAWIGYAGRDNAKKWVSMWAGALIGAAIVFVAANVLQGQIDILSANRSASYAVLGFYTCWVASSVLGVLVARRWH